MKNTTKIPTETQTKMEKEKVENDTPKNSTLRERQINKRKEKTATTETNTKGKLTHRNNRGSARGLIRRAGVTLGGAETAVHVTEGDGKGVGAPAFGRPFKCRSPTRSQRPIPHP